MFSKIVSLSITLLLAFLMIMLISLSGGSLPFSYFIKFGIAFLISLLLGFVILKSLPFTSNFSPISHALLSVFVGLLILSCLVFINKTIGIIGLALVTLGSFILISKDLNNSSLFRKHTTYECLSLLIAVACSLIFAFGDTYAFAVSPEIPLLNKEPGDPYFFINLVNSLSGGTINSATYEINTPLNYQILGYLPAAFLVKYFDIPAHLALYGFELGLTRVLPFVLMIELAQRSPFNTTKWQLLLIPLFYTLLQPLNPIYLLKGDIHNFVWSGLGYVGPSYNMGYTFSFPVIIICLLLITNFNQSKYKVAEFFFVLLLASLAGIKIPIFFAFGCFSFFLSVFLIFYKKDFTLFKTIVFAVPFTLLLAYFLYFGSDSGSSLTFRYSFFPTYFNDLLKQSAPFLSLKIIIGAFLLFILWGGIRFIFLTIGIIKLKQKEISSYAIASLLALLMTIVLASVFNLEIVDEKGHMLRDISYDSLQFIRSGYFIITVISALIGVTYLSALQTKFQLVAYAITFAWLLVSAMALIYNINITPRTTNNWLTDVRKELKSNRNGYLAINPSAPNNKYSIWLTASNPGTFWVSNSGCFTSSKNHYRHLLYQKLLKEQDLEALKIMKKQGVTTLIATPDDITVFTKLAEKDLLKKVGNTKWLFSHE